MAVASLPSTVSFSTFQVKAFSASPFQPQTCKLTCAPHRNVSYYPSSRKVIAQFGIPDKAKMQMNDFKERLWKSMPDSVKDFPWKKAEDQVLQRLLSFGQEALKWSFIAWFFSSFLSDVIVTISRNQELVMPFGLLAGSLMADFMKDTLEDLFPQQEVKGVNWNFLGIATVFVVLKLISTSFASQRWMFPVHVANGGLMQILWLWKRPQVENVEVHSQLVETENIVP